MSNDKKSTSGSLVEGMIKKGGVAKPVVIQKPNVTVVGQGKGQGGKTGGTTGGTTTGKSNSGGNTSTKK